MTFIAVTANERKKNMYKTLTELVKKSLSGHLLVSTAERLSPIVASYLIQNGATVPVNANENKVCSEEDKNV